MNTCTFNPEKLQAGDPVINCPSCGRLVIPGLPHVTDEAPLSDKALTDLATGYTHDESWVNRYQSPVTEES